MHDVICMTNQHRRRNVLLTGAACVCRHAARRRGSEFDFDPHSIHAQRAAGLTDSRRAKCNDAVDDAYLITDAVKRANSIEGFPTHLFARVPVAKRRRATRRDATWSEDGKGGARIR